MQEVVMPFDGSKIEVVKSENGAPFISVRSVCRAIGLDSPTQNEKLQRNPTYKGMAYPTPSVGGPQEAPYGVGCRRSVTFQSYKKQNRKVMNFLRNKLGKGLKLVKD